MLRLWALAFPAGGAGHLPEGGGVMDQAAAVMDALAVMTAAANELRETGRGTEAGG